jgi:anti-sigma regulatory factor (Ser/Thr protein kinase)
MIKDTKDLKNINNEIVLKIPSKENFLVIARLLVSGLLSEYDINIEKIEDIKLILNEAASLLITEPINSIEIIVKWEELNNSIKLIIAITSKDIDKMIINNLMKAGLRIHILNYLCDKFSIENNGNIFIVKLEKIIQYEPQNFKINEL